MTDPLELSTKNAMRIVRSRKYCFSYVVTAGILFMKTVIVKRFNVALSRMDDRL